jgi:hypothetical protein
MVFTDRPTYKLIEGFLLPEGANFCSCKICISTIPGGQGQDEGIAQNAEDNLFLSPHPSPLPEGEEAKVSVIGGGIA